MTTPITDSTGHIVVAVRLYRDIEMRPDIARFAEGALVNAVRSLSLKNLNEVPHDSVARMDGNGRGGFGQL